MRRVVVTGLGAVTPIGLNTDDFWDAIKKNTVGIDTITSFDSSEYKAHLAAEVKGFNAADCMDFKASRRMEKFSQYAVAAAFEALKDSGLNIENEDAYMAGVSVGSGIGSLSAMENSHKKLLEKGPSRINPLLVPMMITNMAAGNVSIQLGLKGKSINVVTACATGTNSIGEAYRSIQHGEADIMFAGGTESAVTPIGIGGFAALTALSESTDPLKASLPFDKNRNGFVMGEGAGIIILEELEHAKKRGAKIYAEIVGYGATSDAYHITSPAPGGEGGARAMKIAMKEANTNPEEITYINAHGTSTHLNDTFETQAIKTALGEENAKNVMVSSTKGHTGHLLGAAGGVAIVCAKAIKEGFVPATINYKVPDEECDLDIVPNEGRNVGIKYAISNSLGFGGHNSSILLKKYED